MPSAAPSGASSRLQFFRYAFGAAGGEPNFGHGEARPIALNLLGNGDIAMDWPDAKGVELPDRCGPPAAEPGSAGQRMPAARRQCEGEPGGQSRHHGSERSAGAIARRDQGGDGRIGRASAAHRADRRRLLCRCSSPAASAPNWTWPTKAPAPCVSRRCSPLRNNRLQPGGVRQPPASGPCPLRPDRAAYSRGPRPSRYSFRRRSPWSASCAACRRRRR